MTTSSLLRVVVPAMIFLTMAVPSAFALDAATRTDRMQQVEKMTPLERAHLERNLAKFKSLPLDKQKQYRDMAAQLDKTKSKTPELIDVYRDYTAWLTTLTPGQRHEVVSEPSAARKLALVRKFREEQQQHDTDDHPPGTPPGERLPFLARGGFGPRLELPELSALIVTINKDLPADKQLSWSGTITPQVCREVIEASIQNTAGGPREWPPTALQNKLRQTLEAKNATDILKKPIDKPREFYALLTLRSALRFTVAEMENKRPKREDRDLLFNNLSPEEQTRLLEMPQEDRQRELDKRIFEQRGEGRGRNPIAFSKELMNQFTHLAERLDLKLPPRGPGGPLGGPGPRGPGGGNRPNDPRSRESGQ